VFLIINLIDVNGAVNLAHEVVARVEPDRSGEHEKADGDDERVAEVEETGHELLDFQGSDEVEDGIKEEVHGRRTGREERPPPPMVILSAKLEIAHNNRNLGTCNDENNKHNKKETENVVKLVLP